MSTDFEVGTYVTINDEYPYETTKFREGTVGRIVATPEAFKTEGYYDVEIASGESFLFLPNELVPVVNQTPVLADVVAHPGHYTSSPAHCSGCGKPVECIDVTMHMGFNLGNVLKYVWRCDLKRDAIEDLRKARQYLDFEIAKRESEAA